MRETTAILVVLMATLFTVLAIAFLTLLLMVGGETGGYEAGNRKMNHQFAAIETIVPLAQTTVSMAQGK